MGVLTLAGCADLRETSPPPPPPPAEQLALLPPIPAQPEPAEVVPPVPPRKPPIPKQPEKALYFPDELIGLDSMAVVKLLGNPLDSRNEGAAHVLTYRGKNCQLDVIFFLDVKTGTERVLSFDQQPAAGRNASACYAALRGGR
jgi:hypothetical protein